MSGPMIIRSQVLALLETLALRYPNQRLCQLLANAIPGDLYYVKDIDMLRQLLELQATYSQLEAAGLKGTL